ncbi:MAG: cysteine desulfurase [Bdellovibrionaceae bacterium]|nr:cysteine desulfurase [Bdellovibrio sp.]
MQKPIYLDYNATTPTDPRVVAAMLPYFTDHFGNPANTLNAYGWSAENAVKKAAEQVAHLIGCKPAELTWNAGATEGNNSVIFGLIRKLKKENQKEPIHLITSNAEHWSVLNSFKAAEEFENIETTYIPTNADGIVTAPELKKHVRPNTRLVSLIWVNNEIGSINPVEELAAFCQAQKIYFHTDATQAVGKIAVNLQNSNIHFLTFSAHKFYGPKGVGILYMRGHNPAVEIEPFILGGGQQNGRRSGTLNVPAIVGAGFAASICEKEMLEDSRRTSELCAKLFSKLGEKIPTLQLNGPPLNHRSPINLSLIMPVSIDLVLPALAGLAFSQGSACHTGETSSSHVLAAIGRTVSEAQRTIRLSLGRWTTPSEIDEAVRLIFNAFQPFLTATAPIKKNDEPPYQNQKN